MGVKGFPGADGRQYGNYGQSPAVPLHVGTGTNMSGLTYQAQLLEAARVITPGLPVKQPKCTHVEGARPTKFDPATLR